MRRTSTTSTCTVQPSSGFCRPVTPSACRPVSSSSSSAAFAATWLARAGGRAVALGALCPELERPLESRVLEYLLLVFFDVVSLDVSSAWDFLAGDFLDAVLLVLLFFAGLARLV